MDTEYVLEVLRVLDKYPSHYHIGLSEVWAEWLEEEGLWDVHNNCLSVKAYQLLNNSKAA